MGLGLRNMGKPGGEGRGGGSGTWPRLQDGKVNWDIFLEGAVRIVGCQDDFCAAPLTNSEN